MEINADTVADIKLDTVERQYWYHGYCAGRIDERKASEERQRAERWRIINVFRRGQHE